LSLLAPISPTARSSHHLRNKIANNLAFYCHQAL
jgi:hypothetical protein